MINYYKENKDVFISNEILLNNIVEDYLFYINGLEDNSFNITTDKKKNLEGNLSKKISDTPLLKEKITGTKITVNPNKEETETLNIEITLNTNKEDEINKIKNNISNYSDNKFSFTEDEIKNYEFVMENITKNSAATIIEYSISIIPKKY